MPSFRESDYPAGMEIITTPIIQKIREIFNRKMSGSQAYGEGGAIRYSSDHILDYIELDDKHSIFEVSVPAEWDSLSIGQLDVRRKYNINVVAVKTNGKLSLSVTSDTVLSKGQTMLVLGEYKALQKFFRI